MEETAKGLSYVDFAVLRLCYYFDFESFVSERFAAKRYPTVA